LPLPPEGNNLRKIIQKIVLHPKQRGSSCAADVFLQRRRRKQASFDQTLQTAFKSISSRNNITAAVMIVEI
jgi:hypothetical protein